MKKDEFNAFLIPDEYLEEIKGCAGVGSKSATGCPSCDKNAPIIGTKMLPPTYHCTGCGCVWRIVLDGGGYYIQILKDGKP